jgi:hypothetical protein
MTVVAAFTYPWDILGDPAAAGRLRELGADTAVLAAAYHSTTALTPRHPAHRVFQAPHSAVYYPPAADRWADTGLRPVAQHWCGTADAFGQSAAQLRDAGLDVHAWIVLAHNSRLARAFPGHAVRNAYDDPSGWALCIAQPEVRAYAATLAAEAAAQPEASAVELESCGWYGYAHLHGHDKTGGIPFREAAQYLLSLCFCRSCRDGYGGVGIDPGSLRAAVRAAMEPLWREGDASAGNAWSAVRDLLGADVADATLRYRLTVAREFQHAVVAAVRAQAGPGCRVVLHADPVAHRTGANPGVRPDDVLAVADGLVVPASAMLDLLRGAGPLAPGTVLAANHQIVSAMGGDPAIEPPARATEIRLYHPGLATDRDLRAAAAAVHRYRARLAASPGTPLPAGIAIQDRCPAAGRSRWPRAT